MTTDIEKIKNQRRKHYLKHRKELIEKSKLYYFNNKEKRKYYLKRYKDEHKQYFRMERKRYKAMKKYSGKLTIKDIQLIYENNIKKHGTLTCCLCSNPIEFLEDSLEHKVPIRLNGDNSIENLDIAHRSCNCSKSNKTIEEFLLMKGLI